MTTVYVGPTILNVATRNTTYSAVPDTLTEAAKEAPYLMNLCVPVSRLASALKQIRNQEGAIYTFYLKALEYGASKQ